MVLKSADVHPVGYPTVAAVESLGKKLSEATGGRLTVEVYPSMQLGGEKETLEQAQVGALAMTRVSVGVMGPIVPELNVFNLPYVFRDVDQMHDVIDGEIGAELLQKITDHPTAGLVGLAWMDAGTRSVYNSKKPVAKMEDLAGPEDPHHGQPDVRRHDERHGRQRRGHGLRPAHQRACRPASSTARRTTIRATRPASTTITPKYYSTTEHLMIPEILVFSKKVWDTLSPEDQALITKLAKEAQQEQRALWMAKEAGIDRRHEGARRRDHRGHAGGEEALPGRDEAGLGQVRRRARGDARAHPGGAVAVQGVGCRSGRTLPPTCRHCRA